ncbi:hypothetical protein [Cellvibrio sp. KY-YJ-3]|uniref:hypothetical protein n=1 Tax=Cellvibrio sp. KY-YJ-3 TaxID=454662 RepID=UPI001246FE6B|nr:hypothetical protein [Cellvibrio sp. KY-YJ-3]QEY12197.1 hypothetical protein D0B88_07980 [Cellvibrio sp. KY-YJ-3]
MNGNLTEFSNEVKTQFFESFPALVKLEHKIVENEECAFCIEIKAPSPKAEHPLCIDTSGEEVTVSFDAYHAHFNEFFGESEYGTAFEFITQIIGGEFAVVSYWRESQWCGSSLLRKENFPINNENYPYANKIQIRSWAGNLDSEIECVPRN